MRNRKPPTRKPSAFTLVEVLVSLVIAVVMAIGVITLLTFNFIYQNQQELRASAMDAMTKEIEKLKRQFIFTVDPYTVTISDNRTPNNPNDDTEATLNVKIFDRDGNELATAPIGYDRITVVMTAQWQGRGRIHGRTFSEQLVSFLIP